MNILVVGVSGFIGQHLYHTLSQYGHHLSGCSRHKVANINWWPCNYKQSPEDWDKQLQNIDIVINAAGIYQQSDKQRFSQIHDLGPKALFDSCKRHGIKVMQISAIGAERENPGTEFLQSKRNADQYLLQQNLPHIVLYPGIVLGERGKSTRQLSLLALLPCMPLVFARHQQLPLISICQLSDHIINLVDHWPDAHETQCLVAKPETMEQLLNNLRHWMGLGRGCFIAIPKQLINLGFYFFPKLSIGAFNQHSIDMLSSYSNKTYTPIANESASDSLIKNKATKSFKKNMRLKLLFYINLMVLGIIWIASGLSSFINMDQSRELISSVGIEGVSGDVVIFTAAIADILLGIFLWHPFLRRWTIYMQMLVMLTYSIILSLYIPIYWLHPFAPIIKNLAMFVLALYLLLEEQE